MPPVTCIAESLLLQAAFPADGRGSMARQALARVPEDTNWFWQDFGSCRTSDPELFYHPQNERGLRRIRRERAAKAICAHCPVRIECADYALRAREPFGIWGGFSEDEREQRLATG